MNREQKAQVIKQISEDIQQSEAVFAVDYRGISVPQFAELRAKLREVDSVFKVVKNSLSQRAADEIGADGIKNTLVGPTAFTFVTGDIAGAAKTLSEFAKETNLLEFKGGLLNGETVTVDQFTAIAKLPSQEVLYGRLAGMVASPITGVVRSLNGLLSGLAVALQQVHDQGLVGEGQANE